MEIETTLGGIMFFRFFSFKPIQYGLSAMVMIWAKEDRKTVNSSCNFFFFFQIPQSLKEELVIEVIGYVFTSSTQVL